jgi:hypothetical protein
MERQPVTSSVIASIGYDADSATLDVEFHDIGTYRYSGVPADVHRELVSAGSHGAYFDAHVRTADYAYAKIA